MKRFITAIVACIMLFVTLGASAEAAPIRQCKDWRDKGVVNITTRRVSCPQANTEIRRWLHGIPSNLTVSVNYHTTDGYSDVRMHNRNGYVIHFHVAQD